jgi:Cu2+-exporting ATPase/Cu+-exporting ATPase
MQREIVMSAAPTQDNRVTAEAIFSLFNLGCSSCSRMIEGRLRKLHGITNVNVDYVTDTVVVGYDPKRLTTDDIRAFMKKVSHDAAEAE